MNDIIEALGKEAYDALSDEERRPLTLFLWGGCCMHKDLYSFKGGNTEMMKEHEPQLKRYRLSNDSGWGKDLCYRAGAILNNKDDKASQGDRLVEFFTAKTGKTHQRFPDTSNIRFGSYGLAAAELIKYLDCCSICVYHRLVPRPICHRRTWSTTL
ncbi:hypothetical protein B0H13DRAFT_2328557 [Mycena leptocephala]|nr:hypothetical protein B0H13DRAFT_2328557 [Mycena leptocephala]